MIASANADWASVIVALIVGLPGIISAIYAVRVHRKVKTPSGTPIGTQIEDTLHTALSNNYHLQSIGAKVEAVAPSQASGEAHKVDALAEPAAAPAEAS